MTIEPPSGPALGGLADYVDMVARFHGLGYACATFGAFSPALRHLILRHDVDRNIEASVTVARLEQARGWRSTFFVMLRNDTYDLAASSGRAALRAIAACGHDIGLHFDPTVYDAAADLEAMVAAECAALEQLLGKPVLYIAPHQPGKRCPEWLGWDHAPAGRIQAYHPRYFREAGYVSDSGGAWAYGYPLDHPKVAAGLGMQILTHPEQWVAA